MLKRFFFKKTNLILFKPTTFLLKKKIFKLNSGLIFFNFFKKNKKNQKYNLTLFLCFLYLFLYKNTILLKRFYYYYIKYNSFKKQKPIIMSFFYFLKKFYFFFLKNKVVLSYLILFKGKIASKGSAKKKKIKKNQGSFYVCNLKKQFFDYKPSSNKQGCVNFKLIFKLN